MHALLAARYTARAAFAMFLLVVVTGPALRLSKRLVWRWLGARRRHLGLAFAGLMALHLVALSINITAFRPRAPADLLAGGIVYVLLALMALTSTDAAQRRMGKWWRRLHWLGVNATLVTFCVSYAGRIMKPDYFWTGVVLAPLAFAALALRLTDMARRR